MNNKVRLLAFKNVSSFEKAFYFFDSDKFTNNHNLFLKYMKKYYDNVTLAYSYKTNYLPFLVKLVNQLGSKAEIVSSMEYQIAKKVSVKDEDIFYNGPIKDSSTVNEILKNGGLVNFDSFDDLNSINWKIFKEKVSIGIRLNASVDSNVSRFGVDVFSKEFNEMITHIKKFENISIKLIHFHLPQRSAKDWEKKLDLFYTSLIHLYNKVDFSSVSVGGGFYSEMDKKTLSSLKIENYASFNDYAIIISNFINKLNKYFGKKIELIIEPGTALVANTFDFITGIYSIKKIHEKTFVSTYGSYFNTNPNNKNTRLPFTVLNLRKDKLQKVSNANFVGFTCIENDYIVNNFSGKLSKDYSLLVIHNCGSYSIVMKPPFILLNYPIYTIHNKKLLKVRHQEYFHDIFNSYVF
jgi:diaminopimelate decarboxylase